MAKRHGDLVDADGIHNPSGFDTAANTTAVVKDETGTLVWRAISELGGTGSTGATGPAGSTLQDRIAEVDVASTGALNLSTQAESGDTVDGQTLSTTTILLLKDQTDATENGWYTPNSSGAPSRISGASAATVVNAGDYSWVKLGTVNKTKRFQVASSATIGTDNLQLDPAEDLQDLPPLELTNDVSLSGAQSNQAIADLSGTGSSTTLTVNWNSGNNQIIDLQDFSGDVTLTLSNPKDGGVYSLLVIQGSTARNIIWPSSVEWAGGSAPTITTTDNKADLIALYYISTLGKYMASASQDFATS